MKTTDNLGRVPPQATDLEDAILGAMMVEKKACFLAGRIMRKEYFYKGANAIIFGICQELQNKGKPVDILTVTEQLRSTGELENVGGAIYIATLTNKVTSSANIEYHCRVVTQKFILRETIRISSETIQNVYNEENDCFEEIDKSISKLAKIAKEVTHGTARELPDIVNELNEQVMANQKGALPGLPTGVKKYDHVTGGQQKGNLIIYAGRPGMGKTARMCCEAYHQLKQGKSVVIHSVEMPEREIVGRILALECNIPPSTILKERFEEMHKFTKAIKWLLGTKLKIFSSNKLSSIILESSMHKSLKGLDIIYVDYLQIVDAGHFKAIDNVSQVSIQLKQLAKQLDVPVVALAQLSRSVETRGGDKKPVLSDLRESGQIEQDADVVEFLYRPEYYDIFEDSEGMDTRGKCFYLNAKCRNGRPGLTTVMKWEGKMNRLSNWEEPVNAKNYFNNESDETPF